MKTYEKKAVKPSNTTSPNAKNKEQETIHMLNFGRLNYILLIVGIVVLAIGYVLLSGGGSDDPNVFNYDMFNSRRLVVAPIVIVCGLLLEIVAIMIRPRKNIQHLDEEQK